jgi:hypothetical protein
MSKPDFIFFVVGPGGRSIVATRFVPATNYKGSRFACWEINSSLEILQGTQKTVEWNHRLTGQQAQLQAMFPGSQILHLHEALEAVQP